MHTFYDFAASPPGLTTIWGATVEERSGCALAAGDTDGNLYDDLFIGAQRGIGSGGQRTGAANVITGDDEITPARLVHYALTASGMGAELVWELDEPVDISLFTVERQRESGAITTLSSMWIESSLPATYRLFDASVSQGVHYVYRVYLQQNLLVSAEIDIPSLDTRLHPNYPNPFRAETTIPFHITEPGHVLMKIYDVSGSLVAAIADGRYGQGPNHIVWDGRNNSGDPAPSGVYFARMLYKGKFLQRKIVLIR
jgi:hypothetical protein